MVIVNLLLCLIYELNFIIGIVYCIRKKNIALIIEFGTACGFWHPGAREGRISSG